MAERTGAGRPRSLDLSAKAQFAALRLAHELGADKVTMERVSSLSGVAKTTLYRRWPSAPHLVMEAFLTDVEASIAYRDEGSLAETLASSLTNFARVLDAPRRRLLCHLIGAAQSNDQLRDAFWDNWIRPRREEGTKVIMASGRSHGEADLILDLLYGAFYYRLLIPYAPVEEDWIRSLVSKVLADAPAGNVM